jgi:hypothetical protein
MFKSNVASWDRIVRVLLGVALLFLGLGGALTGSLGLVAAILGLVFLVTGLVGWCPLYALFKFSTKKA